MPQGDSHAEMIAWFRGVVAQAENMQPESVACTVIVEQADMPVWRAVLAHLERTQWLPIEEAPRDSTVILAYNGDIYLLVFWSGGRWLEWGQPSKDYDNYRPLELWMRLPLPPSPETPR